MFLSGLLPSGSTATTDFAAISQSRICGDNWTASPNAAGAAAATFVSKCCKHYPRFDLNSFALQLSPNPGQCLFILIKRKLQQQTRSIPMDSLFSTPRKHVRRNTPNVIMKCNKYFDICKDRGKLKPK